MLFPTLTFGLFFLVVYAAAWSLTHYLASRKKEKFQDYLREVAKLGPLEPREAMAGADARALFIKHFGSDYPAIGEAIVKHLRGLPYVDPIEVKGLSVQEAQQKIRKLYIDKEILKAGSFNNRN